MRGFTFPPYESLAEKNDREVREMVKKIELEAIAFDRAVEGDGLSWDEPPCGLWWILSTVSIAILFGITFGFALFWIWVVE